MKQKEHLTSCQLTKDFLSRLSAAGISNIVTEKSKRKQVVWLCLLVFTIASMSYMTYKVVYEYLTYPKLVLKRYEYSPTLDFPAVTVCPLSTVPLDYVEKSSLNKLWKLQYLLQNAPTRTINHTIEEMCYTLSFCTWSYFLGRCQCSKSPCEIDYCSPISKDQCSCPNVLCEIMDPSVCQLIEAEETKEDHEDDPCICRMDATSTSVGQQQSNVYTKEALDSIEDADVKNLATLIVNSRTNDLSDMYTQLLPSLADIYNYGAEFSRLILSCSYEGRVCDKRNFTIFHHIIYGKCYMFNYIGNSKITPMLKSIHIGSASGLHLLLDVTPNEKLKLLSPEIGVRVTIHDPRQYPFIAEEGFNVADEMSGIEISLTKFFRLGEPYGKCDPGDGYNQLDCQKGLTYATVKKTCKCTLRSALNGIIFANRLKDDAFQPFCNTTHAECVRNVKHSLEGTKMSKCPVPCNETQFSASVGSSSFNHKFYDKIRFIKTMKTRKENIGALPKDLAGIKVYYTTQRVYTFREIVSYSWDTLLANIGGNLGFFMGLSIVTFLQFTEFLWDLMWTTCVNSLRSSRQRSTNRVSLNPQQLDRQLRFPYHKYHKRRQ